MREVDGEMREGARVTPRYAQLAAGRDDLRLARERGMMRAQPNQVEQAADDGALRRSKRFLYCVVVAVDRAAVAGRGDAGRVVLSRKQADIVNLRDARREKLERAGGEVGVVVRVERGVVRDVDLVRIEARRGLLRFAPRARQWSTARAISVSGSAPARSGRTGMPSCVSSVVNWREGEAARCAAR